ncbi:hypothetical protein A5651_14965 [Mycobacterium sp. 1274761.0]|nr:hypothetical protein A5651_14965 [Mycobacterium sp. 1274761.0]
MKKLHDQGLIADDWYRRTRARVERALNPPTPRAVFPASEVGAGRRRSYCLHGLSRELRRLAETPEGGRNDQLNTSAFKCARFVRDGALSHDEVVGPLRETAIGTGLPASEVDRTIRSAFDGADAKGLTTEVSDRDGYGDAFQIGGTP